MSTGFFDTMTDIEKLAKQVKFLDGSHPVVGDKYEKKVEAIKLELEEVNESLKDDLAKFFKPQKQKASRTGKRKAVQEP